MNMIIVVLVIALIAGILYLNNDLNKEDQRKHHLKGLVDLLNAKIEGIPGRENSFALYFQYRGVSFIYEDIEDTIFEKVVYRAFLRVQLPQKINIVFSEDKRAIFGANAQQGETEAVLYGAQQIGSPRGFQEYSIFSDDPDLAKKLFADDGGLRTFSKFKMKDSRGKPEMAIDIIDGVLTLKFYPLGQGLKPTVFSLRNNISLITNYLEDLLVIYRKVKKG